MTRISETTKLILWIMLLIVGVALVIGLLITGDRSAYIKGLMVGTIFSSIKMVLLERNISRSLDMDATSAENYMRLNFALRYFITAIVLGAVAILPGLDLWGAIAGVFALQLSAYIAQRLYARKEIAVIKDCQ